MSIARRAILLMVAAALHGAVAAGESLSADSGPAMASRVGLSGGMGVSYISAQDLVNLVNATPGASSRVGEFSSVVEFFGAASVPLSGPWALKADYAYLTGSYSLQGLLGQTEYSYAAHMPSLLVQYIIVEGGVYNIKAGLGPGYYVGILTQRLGGSESRFTGSGAGLLLDLEANTALGDDLFAYLGVLARWSGIGALTSENGASPQANFASETTLQFFGVGARLGFSYYF